MDACCLPQFNQLLKAGLLLGVKQVIVEEARCARMRHQVHKTLLPPLFREPPMPLCGSLWKFQRLFSSATLQDARQLTNFQAMSLLLKTPNTNDDSKLLLYNLANASTWAVLLAKAATQWARQQLCTPGCEGMPDIRQLGAQPRMSAACFECRMTKQPLVAELGLMSRSSRSLQFLI